MSGILLVSASGNGRDCTTSGEQRAAWQFKGEKFPAVIETRKKGRKPINDLRPVCHSRQLLF